MKPQNLSGSVGAFSARHKTLLMNSSKTVDGEAAARMCGCRESGARTAAAATAAATAALV